MLGRMFLAPISPLPNLTLSASQRTQTASASCSHSPESHDPKDQLDQSPAFGEGCLDFQAKSGTSLGFGPLFLHDPGKSQFKKSLGIHLEAPDIIPRSVTS